MADITYEVDGADIVRALGDDWPVVAVANGSPALAVGIIGRSLWEFVSGPTTREIYRTLLERVRQQGQAVVFGFDCESGVGRHVMLMRMTHMGHGVVRFHSAMMDANDWPPDVRDFRAPEPLLRVCGWCRSVLVDGEWQDAEHAVEQLGLFMGATEPHITHGICPPCARAMELDTTLSA